ncbi:hypothetical protein ACIPUD_26085 [Bradyrhizobium sp. CAR08]
MVQVVLCGAGNKALRGEWGDLQKELKDANDERNKLAHYTVIIEIAKESRGDDGVLVGNLTSPLLQPSPHNAVSRVQGKTPNNERHSLDEEALKGHAQDFYGLSLSLHDFRDRVRWAMHRAF